VDRPHRGCIANETAFDNYMASFVLSEDETLAEVLLEYEETCARTDAAMSEIEESGRRTTASRGALVS
jgi:hypothetical protein